VLLLLLLLLLEVKLLLMDLNQRSQQSHRLEKEEVRKGLRVA